jgi:ferric-dicitrate binding protein FerR (iron transport regulator)
LKISTPKKFRHMPEDHSRFDHEALVELLIRQQAKMTSRKENALIKKILRESAEARELATEVTETSTNENWSVPVKRRFPLSIAAGVALLVISGAGYLFFAPKGQPASNWKTLDIRKGTTSTIKLADGTEVKLNAASSLRYPASFGRNKREVYIEGEAFFNVAPDVKRPFIVHTGRADVEVLGTSFNIRTYDSSFRAALVSGAIAVSTPEGERIKLLPGYIASMNAQNPQLLVSSYSRDTVLTWLSGTYRFENTPLQEVCRMAERIYDISILIDDKDLAQVRYSGIINRKQPVRSLVEDLGSMADIECYYDESGKLHFKRTKNLPPIPTDH